MASKLLGTRWRQTHSARGQDGGNEGVSKLPKHYVYDLSCIILDLWYTVYNSLFMVYN